MIKCFLNSSYQSQDYKFHGIFIKIILRLIWTSEKTLILASIRALLLFLKKTFLLLVHFTSHTHTHTHTHIYIYIYISNDFLSRCVNKGIGKPI